MLLIWNLSDLFRFFLRSGKLVETFGDHVVEESAHSKEIHYRELNMLA